MPSYTCRCSACQSATTTFALQSEAVAKGWAFVSAATKGRHAHFVICPDCGKKTRWLVDMLAAAGARKRKESER